MSESLVLGGVLDLTGSVPVEGCSIRVMGDDVTWGAPVAATRVLEGLVASGARVALEGYGNREARLRVTIKGPSLDHVARAEGVLFRLLGKRSTLEWQPADPFAAVTVFDVEFSELEHYMDDYGETYRLEREFGIRFDCHPFPREQEQTLTPILTAHAAPVSPTVTVVDACQHNSDNRWKATNSGLDLGVFVGESEWVRNAVLPSRELVTPGVRGFDVTLTRTGTVSLAGTPYVVVRWSNSLPAGGGLFNQIPALTVRSGSTIRYGVPVHTRILNASYAETTYDLGDLTSVTSLDITVRRQSPTWLRVAHIDRTDQIPASGATGHQMTRTITVEGAAPTEAALHLWTDGDKLGDVLIHTSLTPNGMISLSGFLSGEPGTPAAGTVSGLLHAMSGDPVQFVLPAGLFDPARATGYLLMARVSGAVGTITSRAMSYSGVSSPIPIPNTLEPQQVRTSVVDASDPSIVTLGAFTLPPRLVDGEEAGVIIIIDGTALPGTPALDEAWLVDIETGHLTQAKATEAQRRHLWVEPPTLEYPLPRVRTAADADGWAGHEADVESMGRHEWEPGEVHVTTVATDAVGSHLQGAYYRRGHTHVTKAPVSM